MASAFLVGRLLEDDTFRSALVNRWEELRSTVLGTESIMDKIDTHVARLNYAGAIERNFKKWSILGQQLLSNTFVGSSYDEEISYLKEWLNQRLEWMIPSYPEVFEPSYQSRNIIYTIKNQPT